MATKYHILIGALILECAAIGTILAGMPPGMAIGSFLLLHFLASGVLAIFIWPFFPEQYRQPRRLTLLFLCVFSFFIPVLGFVGLILAALASRFLSRLYGSKPFLLVRLPRIAENVATVSSSYGMGGIRSRLLSFGSPTESRMKALLAVQAIPGKLSSPLLREMLGDPVDDIRLVAYGMLDGQEKKINAQIHQTMEKLQQLTEPVQRLPYLKRLSELYWELVYQGLVQSDVMRFALNESLRYIAEAMQVTPNDPDLWLLLGKVRQHNGQLEASEQAFKQAILLGVQESRVIAYLAELAYARRDFAEVKRLLSKANPVEAAQPIQPLVLFWKGAA